MTDQPRQPAGRPVGGQYSERERPESDVILVPPTVVTPIELSALRTIASAESTVFSGRGQAWEGVYARSAGRNEIVPPRVVDELINRGFVELGEATRWGDAAPVTLTAEGAIAVDGAPALRERSESELADLRVLARLAAGHVLHYAPSQPATEDRKRVPVFAEWAVAPVKADARAIKRLVRAGHIEPTSSSSVFGITESGAAIVADNPDVGDWGEAVARVAVTHRTDEGIHVNGGRAWGRAAATYGGTARCSCGWSKRNNEGRKGAVEDSDQHRQNEIDAMTLTVQRERLLG